jgi:hypothetical protein
MKWAGHVSRVGEKRNAYRLLVGKPEGRRPLGRPRRRWDGSEAEWIPFQTNYFSFLFLQCSGIEPGTSGSIARNSDH